jgi:hypothetical protein
MLDWPIDHILLADELVPRHCALDLPIVASLALALAILLYLTIHGEGKRWGERSK